MRRHCISLVKRTAPYLKPRVSSKTCPKRGAALLAPQVLNSEARFTDLRGDNISSVAPPHVQSVHCKCSTVTTHIDNKRASDRRELDSILITLLWINILLWFSTVF
jgi:hypothetical protein